MASDGTGSSTRRPGSMYLGTALPGAHSANATRSRSDGFFATALAQLHSPPYSMSPQSVRSAVTTGMAGPNDQVMFANLVGRAAQNRRFRSGDKRPPLLRDQLLRHFAVDRCALRPAVVVDLCGSKSCIPIARHHQRRAADATSLRAQGRYGPDATRFAIFCSRRSPSRMGRILILSPAGRC